MKNRVYGVIGIQTKNNNFNADFQGMPRQNPMGDYFASDKALKYACRRHWVDNNEKVLVFKSFKEIEGKKDSGLVVVPKNLKERYESFFGELTKKSDHNEVLKNLFSCVDVSNFGLAFPVEGCNFSITGVAQLDNGINKMEETSTYSIEQLSPFQDSTKEDAKNSTLGNKSVVDEAHYFYNLIVNPCNFNNYKDYTSYKEEYYLKLKEGLMKGVTSLNTQTKVGSVNEFGLFVKLKEDSKLYIPCLTDFIDFTFQKDNKNIIDLSKLSFLEKYLPQIEEIEIICNEFTTELITPFDSEKVVIKSIFEI